MRWMILWLVLTAIWISYSSLAGSGPKVTLIPPALVLIALVFTWLWKRLVVRIAGEFEPSHFHSHRGAALLLGGLVGGFAVYAVDSALTPQLRPDAGADNQSAAPASQNTPPVRSFLAFVPGVQRIIGGAKPDPSAGTPGPAPALQSQAAPQPLGPASQFQPPSTTPAQATSGIAQQLGAQHQSNQPPSNQARGNQASGNQQQVATPAQQQTAPQASATPAPHAAIANDDDRPAASRRVRHPHKQATFTSNAPRYRDENYVPRYGPDQYGAWSGGATQPRVYNSYGEPRFGPDARYLRRSRVIPRSPETLYLMQTGPPRREQYWGGYRYGD